MGYHKKVRGEIVLYSDLFVYFMSENSVNEK